MSPTDAHSSSTVARTEARANAGHAAEDDGARHPIIRQSVSVTVDAHEPRAAARTSGRYLVSHAATPFVTHPIDGRRSMQRDVRHEEGYHPADQV